MATTNLVSLLSFTLTTSLLLLSNSSPSHSFKLTFKKSSTISSFTAAGSPALSPDSMPLLPTPGGTVSPPESSLIPTIPSSPSPPNPDSLVPSSPLSPSELPAAAAESSALVLNLGFNGVTHLLFLTVFIPFFFFF
ncbi:hypothetical protein IHE45_19G130800 [Dioscorea alata]|uniref:Uncharacterized protein n=1 Tax=Dioscorea alata TaxID=55571 RepID=A0ACB7U1W0_DIOAL|nr:hypothetical protein IHE45_19G130800 [Dioscorea alata]